MEGVDLPIPFLFFVLIIGLMIVMGILGHLQAKRRREELKALATRLGLSFSGGRYRKFDRRYPAFKFLRKGSNRYAENVIHGSLGEFQVEAFDYHYETHSTDSDGDTQTHHHRFTVIAFEAPFSLGRMTIRPEGFFDKISAAFGWDDINFESAEFSRRYHVRSDDRKWAYDVLHPRSIELLLKAPRYPWYFHGQNLVLKGDTRFEPERTARLLDVGARLLEGIPEFSRTA